MKVLDCVQGDETWIAAHVGRITGSRVAAATAVKKRGTGEPEVRARLKRQLVAEIRTGKNWDEGFRTRWTEEGKENEKYARDAHEQATGLEVDRVGFVLHPRIERAGASPDGIMPSVNGTAEYKCPKITTHIEYLMDGVVPEIYVPQITWELACTGADFCDFVSYNDELPMLKIRVYRDEKQIAAMEAEVEKFLAEVNEVLEKLGGMYTQPGNGRF